MLDVPFFSRTERAALARLGAAAAPCVPVGKATLLTSRLWRAALRNHGLEQAIGVGGSAPNFPAHTDPNRAA